MKRWAALLVSIIALIAVVKPKSALTSNHQTLITVEIALSKDSGNVTRWSVKSPPSEGLPKVGTPFNLFSRSELELFLPPRYTFSTGSRSIHLQAGHAAEVQVNRISPSDMSCKDCPQETRVDEFRSNFWKLGLKERYVTLPPGAKPLAQIIYDGSGSGN